MIEAVILEKRQVLREISDIIAGTEINAFGRNHDHTHSRIGRGLRQPFGQGGIHCFGQGVFLGRPVEPERKYAVIEMAEDVAHLLCFPVYQDTVTEVDVNGN